jgi:hypothetical protein
MKNYLHKKGNNKHNQGGNMNNFISRVFVISLLFSFVYAQDASGIKKGANDDTKNPSTSKVSKTKGSSDGKATPSGNSSRMSGTTAPAPKKGKKAKKGLLGRLFSRSSKKSSKASGSSAAGSARPSGSQSNAGDSKESGDKSDPGETDSRDKP